ncbi:hypothetical protein FDP41_000722 [Naegleria fowleri]|uniref:Phytanoyl-CoA dioxygenase n=1 Tax=Naegleria fowleri TaxID=5763 RepID=A0A6A5C344_NAEFO|nr:uncharacterized protein FDP41_000722 [Naegleria fowleri]KAF0984823.1 hypothetical protein FDP41_000722 [Naegleria fowleri]CAG4711003.1 unnamed protein product [Naegleria fowleri]
MSQQASNHALTSDQIEFFNQNGFLIIENFIPPETNSMLRERIKYVVEHQFKPNKNHAVFSTYKQDSKRDLEKYFEDSVDNISFFLEKNANIDPETGELKQDKFSCINKIGHALHEKDEVFRKFSHQPKLYEIVKTLSHFERPIILQSMVIFKQPFIGGEVIAHHDATFLYNELENDTTENPVIGCWFALEDATRENGCLWVLPGSHKWGCIKRWVRVPSETDPNVHEMKMEVTQPDLLQYTTEMNYEHDKYIPVEVKSGTLVLLHGYLLHKSFENTSSKSREAYTLHVLDQAKPFSKRQWIQPKRELVNYFETQND